MLALSTRSIAMLVLVLCIATAARARAADDTWILTTADFKTVSGEGLKTDANAFTLQVSGKPETYPFASVVQISRTVGEESPSGLVLCVAGGQRLVGKPQTISGLSLVWFTVGAGEIRVPIDQCLGVLRDRTDSPELTLNHAEDAVKLSTGDTVHGIITAVSDAAITVTPAAGDPANVPVDSIASLMFASPPNGRKPVATAPMTVSIGGGSVVACKSIAIQGDTLHGAFVAGGAMDLPLKQVIGIENTSGPVQWLSSRTPTETTFTPFMQGNYPPRMNASVTGQPIRVGGVTFTKGIGVHSRTKLVYTVLPTDGVFRTRYAIDGSLNLADVEVRVLVDDKIVHETKSFKAGAISPVITADLSGAKTLTLEVDYGRAYDVQDRLNWIEPAIIKK